MKTTGYVSVAVVIVVGGLMGYALYRGYDVSGVLPFVESLTARLLGF